MDSPMQRASPPAVKEEPQEDVFLPTSNDEPDYVNLISDGEADTTGPAPTAGLRRLGSPFAETAVQPTTSTTVNLGASLFSATSNEANSGEKPSKPKGLSDAMKQRIYDRQKELAQKMKKTTPLAQSPAYHISSYQPLGVDSNATSPLFVTQRTGDNTATAETPARPASDPAKLFAALKRGVNKKRKNGTITIEEEIEFIRADNDEKARLQRERLEKNFDDMTTPEPEQEVDPEQDYVLDLNNGALNVPYLEMSEDEEPKEPEEPKKKGGRKRKAPEDKEQAPPKKRGRPSKKAAPEKDILDQVRDKQAAKKAQGRKAAGKAAAGKDKGRGKKYEGPNMTNPTSVFGSNVFQDTEQNSGMAPPTFAEGTTRRSKALSQLIADVPQESKRTAQIDKRYLDEAMKSFSGQRSIQPAEDGNWSLKGLKVTLKHYQVLGVAFLRNRENSSVQPKGGILADEMGLGKTIQMLANIVNGKALVGPKKCKTTLIVASPALVTQWRKEIADKVYTVREDKKHGIGRVKEYHASAQLKSNEEQQELEECDIVLTTYTQVTKSYPKADVPADKVTAESKAAWWRQHWAESRGILHRIRWNRVVLDEAQAIKNHRSLTSVACRALEATHYWPHTGSFKIFKNNFVTPDDPDGIERLNVFLRKFMLRRTHAARLFDAKLLDLPKPTEHIVWLDFNKIESSIYSIIRARFVSRINCISKTGNLDKQYNHIWVMLLRLRQLCSSILLVQGTMVDLLTQEDVEKLKNLASEFGEGELDDECEDMLRHLNEMMKNAHSVKNMETNTDSKIILETETSAIERKGAEGADVHLGGSHGTSFRFNRYLDSLIESDAWAEIAQRTLCCGCRQPPQEPQITSCFHIFCLACLMDLQHRSARRGYDVSRCAECGEAYTHVAKCDSAIQKVEKLHDGITGSTDRELNPAKAKKKSSPDAMENWICMKGEILPSAKTMAVKMTVLAWIKEDPDCKIIIYSQFIPMLHLLSRICTGEGWEHVRYTGSMSHDNRQKAIDDFGDPTKGKRIMLASLKCGGLGLNLTMASRVLTLDPWWNSAVEQQAFCRCFRIGQTKETRFNRLVVKGSIDEAIVRLQKNKQIDIDAVMDDSKRKEKLSIHELMRLFGQVKEDGDGHPFIFAEDAFDEDEEPQHMRPVEELSENDEDGMGNEE